MVKMTYEAKVTIELNLDGRILGGELLDEFIDHYGLTKDTLTMDLEYHLKNESEYYPHVSSDNPRIKVEAIKFNIGEENK